MMPDRTVRRAVRAGIGTVPIDKPHPKQIRGNIRITPDELAIAMEIARAERIEHAIHAYAARGAE